MQQRGSKYYQRRWQIGFDGNETNAEEMSVDYVIGSGKHARSYLHRTSHGALIELPLGWYAENGGIWGMSPGFDSRHPGTRRLLPYECIYCHDGYPNVPKANPEPGAEPVFAGELPEGIDCTRCHGPAERHLELAGRGASREQIRASIVNPARLSPKLRMDVCLQCHLETTSTAFPAIVRRFDRGPFSFRPGESLTDFLLSFDHAPGTGNDDKFEIVGSAAYRLRKSRCFLESGDRLTCETCHDPHRIPRGTEAVQSYASVCRQCHAGPLKTSHPAGEDCAGCHMPKRRTEDVVHVAMTDHLIQRRPPANPLALLAERHLSESQAYRGEVVSYDGQATPLYLAYAQVAMKNNLFAGVTQLERLLTAQPQTDPQWYLQLGDAWLNAGNFAKAESAYRQALRLRPQSLRAIEQLAQVLRVSGDTALAIDQLRRATQIAPSNAATWEQFGSMLPGSDPRKLAAFQKAITLDPDLPGAFTTFAGFQAAAGQRPLALEALREALRIDPYDAAAWDLAGR
ncbi:MAG: tetratricopeptide repeat protein, partial [Acidobacteriota bacterium]